MSESCRGDNDWFASVKDIKTVVVGTGCCAACDQSMATAGVANRCETVSKGETSVRKGGLPLERWRPCDFAGLKLCSVPHREGIGVDRAVVVVCPGDGDCELRMSGSLDDFPLLC